MNVTAPNRLVRVCLIGLAAFLALEPAQWLYRTWTDPAFGSLGLWVFVGVGGLSVWSASSAKQTDAEAPNLWPALVATAAIRALGHLISIHVLAAFSLAFDVYVLARLGQLDRRARRVSPAALAVLFAMSLPLERVLQRLVGFPLQWSAAALSEPLLALTSGAHVERHGTRLLLDQVDVIVDLPCSGAQGLYLAAVFTVASLALRPTGRRAALGVLLAGGAGAVCGNVLRIVLIALSAHTSERFFGLDLTMGAGHELAGVVGLVFGLIPPVLALRHTQTAGQKGPGLPRGATRTSSLLKAAAGLTRRATPCRGGSLRLGGWRGGWRGGWLRTRIHSALRSPKVALLCMAAAGLVVAATPRTAFDVSHAYPELTAPSSLGGVAGVALPLSDAEHAAYAAAGGSAMRIQYDDLTLLMIKTSAPLRHLHEPFECLRALGVQTQRVGVSYDGVPSAIYRVTTEDAAEWRIAVTYISDSGHLATSVGEVVWQWLHSPGESWTAYQRVTGWDSADALAWDAHVAAAFEFPSRTGAQQ